MQKGCWVGGRVVGSRLSVVGRSVRGRRHRLPTTDNPLRSGPQVAFILPEMGEPPRERPQTFREKWTNRLVLSRSLVWSWLTDPAVLVYRRHGFGHKRLRATIVEFFLF